MGRSRASRQHSAATLGTGQAWLRCHRAVRQRQRLVMMETKTHLGAPRALEGLLVGMDVLVPLQVKETVELAQTHGAREGAWPLVLCVCVGGG